MSCAWCQYCGALVDTDDDSEAIFDTDTQLDVIACEPCREMPEVEREINDAANDADLYREDFL